MKKINKSVHARLKSFLNIDAFWGKKPEVGVIYNPQVTSFEPYTSLRRTARWIQCVSRRQSSLTIKPTSACAVSCYSARSSTLSGQFPRCLYPVEDIVYVSLCQLHMCKYSPLVHFHPNRAEGRIKHLHICILALRGVQHWWTLMCVVDLSHGIELCVSRIPAQH